MKNFLGTDISREQAKFYFIFAPNNSGTTVLSQYLAVQLDAYLPKSGNNEGQMVPSVTRMMRERPWDPGHRFDWPHIRSEWEKLSRGALFVEASPPNLMRFEDIAAVFGADSSAMSLICSPYQQIASCMRRYKAPPFAPEDLVERWVMKATRIRAFRQAFPHFPALTYKAFVDDPGVVNRLLDLPVIRADIPGKKGSGARGITDQSAAAILFLTRAEIDAVSAALAPHEDLLRFFGFDIRTGEEMYDICSRDPTAAPLARKRRERWQAPPGAPSLAAAILGRLRGLSRF